MTPVANTAATRAKTERGNGTTSRLIAATVELLEEGGYARADVSSITGRAGVAAGTLYRHFPSKAELFVDVFRNVCAREYEAMRKAGETTGTASERVDAVVEVFAERALANPRLAWALLAEPVDPLVDAERLEFRRRYRDLIAGLLKVGVDARELPEQDTQLTAAALVGAIGDGLVGPLAPSGSSGADSAAVIAELQRFCRRAIGAAESL